MTGLAYLIWRFNPVFTIPKLTRQNLNDSSSAQNESTSSDYEIDPNEQEVKLYIQEPGFNNGTSKKNMLRSEGGVVVIPPGEDEENHLANNLKIVEKEITKQHIKQHEEKELGEEELVYRSNMPINPEKGTGVTIPPSGNEVQNLELQIKKIAGYENNETREDNKIQKLPLEELYEPTLDLSDYKYPSLDLLETHGSEKIVQDPAELEANKDQIISTLRNYDITIQKIFATVGPTVTLYEIVPAAGVRISRIKNLEDDIALSLAALGIRIIAPIPGKGTIGIEVPNVKKTVVSIKTLLASEKFQHNNYNLPIAIGKKLIMITLLLILLLCLIC